MKLNKCNIFIGKPFNNTMKSGLSYHNYVWFDNFFLDGTEKLPIIIWGRILGQSTHK